MTATVNGPPQPGMNRARGFAFGAAALGAGLAAVYLKVVRPWALRWGKMMRGIKKRAERLAARHRAPAGGSSGS